MGDGADHLNQGLSAFFQPCTARPKLAGSSTDWRKGSLTVHRTP